MNSRFVGPPMEVCITVCRTVCMTVCMVCRTAGSQHAPPQTATSNRSGKATHIVDTRPAVPRRKQVVRKKLFTSWIRGRPLRADTNRSGKATHIVGPKPAFDGRWTIKSNPYTSALAATSRRAMLAVSRRPPLPRSSQCWAIDVPASEGSTFFSIRRGSPHRAEINID